MPFFVAQVLSVDSDNIQAQYFTSESPFGSYTPEKHKSGHPYLDNWSICDHVFGYFEDLVSAGLPDWMKTKLRDHFGRRARGW